MVEKVYLGASILIQGVAMSIKMKLLEKIYWDIGLYQDALCIQSVKILFKYRVNTVKYRKNKLTVESIKLKLSENVQGGVELNEKVICASR